MKRNWVIMLFTMFPILGFAESYSVEKARWVFESVAINKEAGKQFIEYTSTLNPAQNNLLYGYRGAVMMVMAKHYFNPYHKWQSFNEGKEILETAIQKQPGNIELIFLRYTIQSRAPHFLNYHDKTERDRALLEKKLPSLTDIPLKQRIENFFALQQNQS